MGVLLKLGGDVVLNAALNCIHVFTHRNTGAVAQPEDMGIHRLCRHFEPHVQHHIGGFAAHTRQANKRRAGGWHLAAILIYQNLRRFDYVFGFLLIKPDGFDMLNQVIFAQCQHFGRSIRDFEQRFGGFINTHICGLRRKRHRHHQSISIHVVQLALWLRLTLAEPRENLVNRVIIELLGHGFRCHARGFNSKQNIAQETGGIAPLPRYAAPMEKDPYHYALIKRAIEYIDAQATAQPSLAKVAAEMGLSEAHFQRVFRQWTGVSPKKYLQYLTLNQAREMLVTRHTLLDTSLATGLSGPSRLHDLFVSWEAMTPGEYALHGEGLRISYGWFDSPFGDMLALATERGICGLGFANETGRAATEEDLFSRWPKADFVRAPEALRSWVEAALGGKGEAKLLLSGSPLQIKVWEALLSIPSGHVTTYSDIASRIGKPKATRAVGTAVGRNPISWIIPCHRALRKSGALGGYHWGLPVKRALLARESAQLEAAE